LCPINTLKKKKSFNQGGGKYEIKNWNKTESFNERMSKSFRGGKESVLAEAAPRNAEKKENLPFGR